MLSEEAIRNQLDEIKKLKEKIATRVWQTTNTVFDNKGRELSELNIQKQIVELADRIIAAYPNECPVLVGVLVGGVPFASKLFEELENRGYSFDPDYMQTSSYKGGLKSGNVTINLRPKTKLGNRVVLVIDDVIDTGNTWAAIQEFFIKDGAKEVHLVALVDKKQDREKNCHAKFSGFEISKDEFIVGFGLDLLEKLRTKKEIKSVNKQFLATPEERALLSMEEPLNEQLEQIEANKKCQVSLATSRDTMFGSVTPILPFTAAPPPALNLTVETRSFS